MITLGIMEANDTITSDERLIGYARVSTEEQNLDMQVDALLKAGCSEDDIFKEYVSGANPKRPQLELALKSLRAGDTFIVWRLDRFARSMKDLITKLEMIETKGACFRSLSEHIDMSSAGGRFMMHVMGAMAEFERQLIADRTRAGMRAAIARGLRPGRVPTLEPDEIEKIQRWRDGGMSATQLVAAVRREFGKKVSRQTIYNWTTHPIHNDDEN